MKCAMRDFRKRREWRRHRLSQNSSERHCARVGRFIRRVCVVCFALMTTTNCNIRTTHWDSERFCAAAMLM